MFSKEEEKVNPLDLSPGTILVTYLLFFVMWFAIFGALNLFWGDAVLIRLGDLGHGSEISEGLSSVWFIFYWGAGVTLLFGLLSIGKPREFSPARVFGMGLWISLNAGLFEELIYRWLRFSIAMIILPFTNFLFFWLRRWFRRNHSLAIRVSVGSARRLAYPWCAA